MKVNMSFQDAVRVGFGCWGPGGREGVGKQKSITDTSHMRAFYFVYYVLCTNQQPLSLDLHKYRSEKKY